MTDFWKSTKTIQILMLLSELNKTFKMNYHHQLADDERYQLQSHGANYFSFDCWNQVSIIMHSPSQHSAVSCYLYLTPLNRVCFWHKPGLSMEDDQTCIFHASVQQTSGLSGTCHAFHLKLISLQTCSSYMCISQLLRFTWHMSSISAQADQPKTCFYIHRSIIVIVVAY